MYDVNSKCADEFISHEEILETLAYADENKENVELIDAIIEKAKKRKGLSHREASVLLACPIEEKNQEIYKLAEQIKKDFYGNRIVMFAPLYLSNYCINGKLKVVFIEDYRVSNAEIIFAAADVSEQISTASKEASGTGNMKFMLNGAPTLGTMDGENVEIVQEVGEENAFIFGLSSEEVINYENNGGYYPMNYFNNDPDIRQVLMQLINGMYSNGDMNMFREIYDSLVNEDVYFTLADFKSYAAAQERVEAAYRDEAGWAKSAILNVAHSGKFTSDRTIQQYVDEIWHLDKVTVK